MTRIFHYLVLITVMTASGRTQRGYSSSYLQNPRSIIFPDTRTSENNEYPKDRPTDNTHSNLQDPRRQRIQNRVSEMRRTETGLTSRIQLHKRGGHRKHYITKLFLELFAALGALEAEASAVVFPGPSSKSRFAPEISDECRKVGYCERIANYPKEEARKIIQNLGDDLRLRFQADELDTNDIQIAQRFGSEDQPTQLCDSSPALLEPDSLQDKNGEWWTVLQDRDNNMTQRFAADICKQKDSGCNALISFPPGYTHKCEQKYMFRSMLVVENNKPIAQKSLQVPTCCSCVINAPRFK